MKGARLPDAHLFNTLLRGADLEDVELTDDQREQARLD